MITLMKASPAQNEKNGSGKYSTPRRRKKRKTAEEINLDEFSYLNSSEDLTMQFSRAQDPIYVLFAKVEAKSIPGLMKDFVKDSFFEVASFVSKVIK